MKKSTSGFTIVELLIVIVVIGILAAIVIVAFNGVQARATFTKIQTDLKSIDKALAIYHAEKGVYPLPATGSGTWAYSCDYSNVADFIPDISSVTSSIPQAPCANPNPHHDTWIYRSNGTDYKLMLIRGNTSLTSLIPATLVDQHPTRDERSWGYWSAGGRTW